MHMFEYIFSSAGRRVVAAGQKRADSIYAFKVANIFFNALSARCLPMNAFFLFLLLLSSSSSRIRDRDEFTAATYVAGGVWERGDVLFSKKFAFAYLWAFHHVYYG